MLKVGTAWILLFLGLHQGTALAEHSSFKLRCGEGKCWVDRLMGMSLPPVLALGELIQVLGLSKTRVRQLISAGELPPPIATLGVGKIWSTQDVVAWCERTGRVVRSPSGKPERTR